ncbi:hypothetical protein [Hymenobacter sp. YC55]|uniref:hypothetical protein n=1 Tax=Hymenobacter sp. YC55 TaxID=3034019 RepID=UPI0023F8CC4E|nr:hypothetical protein [Hymenobacter sp. YC55]MDF7815722.1 hypothetical protein [Hymenobacter sp. YC55]
MLITDVIFTRHYELLQTLAGSAGYDLMCLAGMQVLRQELGALVSPSPPLPSPPLPCTDACSGF